MSGFPADYHQMLARCQQEGLPTSERGGALEDLIAHAFSAIPGVEVRARNAKSVFANEELDLMMANLGHPDGLRSVGPHFSVECKNWSKPVGSIEVCWFATKLRRSGQGFGVLVAAHGITGEASDLTAAHFEAASALSEGQAVVVLTLAELAGISQGEQLAKVLGEKHGCLVARREIKIFEEVLPANGALHLAVTEVPPLERRAMIDALVDDVEQSPTLLRSLEVTLGELWPVVDRFIEIDDGEPSLSDGGEEGFNRWSELNLIAFENVEEGLRRLGRACIAGIRTARESSWTPDRLVLGIEMRTPSNLHAPPDSGLARLLLSHWAQTARGGLSYESEGALLCILAWSIDWLAACDEGRWPPPWV